MKEIIALLLLILIGGIPLFSTIVVSLFISSVMIFLALGIPMMGLYGIGAFIIEEGKLENIKEVLYRKRKCFSCGEPIEKDTVICLNCYQETIATCNNCGENFQKESNFSFRSGAQKNTLVCPYCGYQQIEGVVESS